MTASSATTTALLVEALGRVLPDDRLVVDGDVLASLSHDQAEWAPVGRAAVGVRTRSESEVQAVVRIAAGLGTPIVTRGAGTGLSGGANAVDGCVVLDLSRRSAVVEVDGDNLLCVEQPGVVNDVLKAAVAEHGLWYPPDPASSPWSTIGGNVATNAGGLCCLKYGVTRDYVLGMRAVVGGDAGYGTAVALGRRTNKGVAGYDMTGLMVGSESTLGVVTEVTLPLRAALRGTPRTIVGSFANLVDAGRATAVVTRRGLVPSALELLDRACLEAVEEWKHLGLESDAAALLLARVDPRRRRRGGGAGRRRGIRVGRLAVGRAVHGRRRGRGAVHGAAARVSGAGAARPVLTEDICVPLSAVPAMLAEVEAIAARNDVRIATIAHAGDGNLHPLLLTPAGDEVARVRAQVAFEQLLDAAIALGGTVTGEHGVGLLKRGGMVRELDPGSLVLQRSVKAALDPLDVFNPGKVL